MSEMIINLPEKEGNLKKRIGHWPSDGQILLPFFQDMWQTYNLGSANLT